MSQDAKVQIGLSTDYLEGTAVDTPAGAKLFREGVVLSDPDVAGARARITKTSPAVDDYGVAVRVIGGVVVGSEVEIKNDTGNPIPVSGSVNVLNQLVPTAFNSIALTYNGDGTVATVTYKQGSTTVATLTLSYTSGNLTNVART